MVTSPTLIHIPAPGQDLEASTVQTICERTIQAYKLALRPRYRARCPGCHPKNDVERTGFNYMIHKPAAGQSLDQPIIKSICQGEFTNERFDTTATAARCWKCR